MNDCGRLLWLAAGLVLGGLGVGLYLGQNSPALAANDRYEDYIMATGAVSTSGRAPTDGVWLLDYRSGKLLGTVIDRTQGKIQGWAEMDLTSEFNISPKDNVHFLMTTGNIAAGQAALYIAEVKSGKFGVYTLGADANTQTGVGIRRHDLLSFRKGS